MSGLRRVTGKQVFLRHRDGSTSIFSIYAGEILGPGMFNQFFKDAGIVR